MFSVFIVLLNIKMLHPGYWKNGMPPVPVTREYENTTMV